MTTLGALTQGTSTTTGVNPGRDYYDYGCQPPLNYDYGGLTPGATTTITLGGNPGQTRWFISIRNLKCVPVHTSVHLRADVCPV